MAEKNLVSIRRNYKCYSQSVQQRYYRSKRTSYSKRKTNQSSKDGFQQTDTSSLRSYTLLAKLKFCFISPPDNGSRKQKDYPHYLFHLQASNNHLSFTFLNSINLIQHSCAAITSNHPLLFLSYKL